MPEFSPRGNVGIVQKIALAEIYTIHSFAQVSEINFIFIALE